MGAVAVAVAANRSLRSIAHLPRDRLRWHARGGEVAGGGAPSREIGGMGQRDRPHHGYR